MGSCPDTDIDPYIRAYVHGMESKYFVMLKGLQRKSKNLLNFVQKY